MKVIGQDPFVVGSRGEKVAHAVDVLFTVTSKSTQSLPLKHQSPLFPLVLVAGATLFVLVVIALLMQSLKKIGPRTFASPNVGASERSSFIRFFEPVSIG